MGKNKLPELDDLLLNKQNTTLENLSLYNFKVKAMLDVLLTTDLTDHSNEVLYQYLCIVSDFADQANEDL